MSYRREITLCLNGESCTGSELERELVEVIKSLEEAAQEIEKLVWDKEEKKGASLGADS
jgi:hypothetical protein